MKVRQHRAASVSSLRHPSVLYVRKLWHGFEASICRNHTVLGLICNMYHTYSVALSAHSLAKKKERKTTMFSGSIILLKSPPTPGGGTRTGRLYLFLGNLGCIQGGMSEIGEAG